VLLIKAANFSEEFRISKQLPNMLALLNRLAVQNDLTRTGHLLKLSLDQSHHLLIFLRDGHLYNTVYYISPSGSGPEQQDLGGIEPATVVKSIYIYGWQGSSEVH